jgi:hypothetical protein
MLILERLKVELKEARARVRVLRDLKCELQRERRLQTQVDALTHTVIEESRNEGVPEAVPTNEVEAPDVALEKVEAIIESAQADTLTVLNDPYRFIEAGGNRYGEVTVQVAYIDEDTGETCTQIKSVRPRQLLMDDLIHAHMTSNDAKVDSLLRAYKPALGPAYFGSYFEYDLCLYDLTDDGKVAHDVWQEALWLLQSLNRYGDFQTALDEHTAQYEAMCRAEAEGILERFIEQRWDGRRIETCAIRKHYRRIAQVDTIRAAGGMTYGELDSRFDLKNLTQRKGFLRALDGYITIDKTKRPHRVIALPEPSPTTDEVPAPVTLDEKDSTPTESPLDDDQIDLTME